jgi:uncharacterized protein YdeI (YjbR/CyaY-like superfamily)
MTEPAELLVRDVAAFRRWLDESAEGHAGAWVVLAKKGTTEPTTLTYDEALDEALCSGWIDGQVRRRDESTYLQRFTPRRPRSKWSKRNVARVEELEAQGRMRPAGRAAFEAARQDGRLADAYPGQAQATVPDDLALALERNPDAARMFELLTSQNRYSILHRIHDTKRPDTRARRIEQFVAMLARGETIHPQRRGRDG